MYTFCIAEDEFYVQKSIMGRLRALKFDLACMGTAFTGEEAEKLYDRFRPDIFFVDINMPQTDGISFIENVRRKDPDCRTLFIIISGYSDYRNMHRAIKADVFDYLQKPIVPEEFSLMMKRAVEVLEKEARESVPVDVPGQEEQGKEQQEERQEQEEKIGEERIAKVCSYIQIHYQEDLNARVLGEIFYLSPSYIAHMFTKHVGRSLGKYLEDVRLAQAEKLLRNTDLLVAEISERVGYHDSNYFTKCFRKKYQISPSEVRSSQEQKGPDE